jgi:long-chain acyl-CoA synthetase
MNSGMNTMSYDEAIAEVTAVGGRYEIVEADVLGVELRVFKFCPPSLRDLFASSRERSDQLFLVYEDERYTFGEVMALSDALADVLVNRYNVRKGDRVAIAMRNYPEWIVSFIAITSVGGISVSLNALWTADELDYAVGDCGAKVVIADDARIQRMHMACEREGARILAVRAEGDMAAGIDLWSDVVRPGAGLPQVEIAPDDDATILYTSGTTGRPKGAVSTHRAVLQSLMAFGCRGEIDKVRRLAAVDTDGAPAFILIVPLFHVTGGVAVLLNCIAAGVKLVIMYKWDVERALQLIERERVTNFVGVPTQSWDLVNSPNFATYDTSSLRRIGGGGAPAPAKLVEKVSKSFPKGAPNLGYGMTETNAYGPQNAAEDFVSHPTSTGRSVPTMEIEIRDPQLRSLPRGESGEIWFKGPMLIRGYWGKPEATEETIVDGWLCSGDLGRIDAEGFVYVEDRAKDMILRGGENVYCAEVEGAIYEHPAIHEAAVFGVPHERLGEEVGVAIHLNDGATIDIDQLKAHVGERLAAFKVPAHVFVLPEPLPRNAAGKFLKRELRDQLSPK